MDQQDPKQHLHCLQTLQLEPWQGIPELSWHRAAVSSGLLMRRAYEQSPELERRRSKSIAHGQDENKTRIEVECGVSRTFKQAMASSQAQHWAAAAAEEILTLIANGTWELVELPPGEKAIPSG